MAGITKLWIWWRFNGRLWYGLHFMLHKIYSEMWWPFVVSHYFWVTAKKPRYHCELTEQTAKTVSANFSQSLMLVMWYKSISLCNTEAVEFLSSQMYFVMMRTDVLNLCIKMTIFSSLNVPYLWIVWSKCDFFTKKKKKRILSKCFNLQIGLR